MKETSDRRSAVALALLKERAERAERMLMFAVLAAGEIAIPDQLRADPRKIELTTWRDDADMSYRLTAKRT